MQNPKGSNYKILHLISSAGFLGADSVVLELAKESIAAGYLVTIGQFENQHNPHLELAEAARNLGLKMHTFPCRGRFDLHTIRDIRHFIQQEKPNLIHSHGYKSNFYGLSANRNQIPWIVTNHLWKRTNLSLKLYAGLDSLLMRFPKKIVAVSDEIADEMVKVGISPKKITVISNGIDLQRFSNQKKNYELKSSFGFDINSKVIGTVASLTVEKGHIYLINATRALISSFPEVRFLFVGDGVERQNLEKQVGELGLQGRIIFAGSRKDIAEILSILDIFVLPSLKEGLPMALLEAMASKLPVVASNVGAIPKVVVDRETGFLTKPGDCESLYNAILELLLNQKEALRLGERGYEMVEKAFSAKEMSARYLDVYDNILTTKKKGL